MLRYKDVLVAKGSALYEAMMLKDVSKAEAVYKETTIRYKQMHSAEDRAWFAEKGKL